MADWGSYLETHAERFQDELLEFLRIPSISALPQHAGDVRQAAGWVEARLQAAGVEHTEILEVNGTPAVYAESLVDGDGPTVLVYGHFDTQPVDPVELWTNPPFEPVIRDDRVFARGATDDKGNMLIPILATEAVLQTAGRLPVSLKFLFEGEEEIGSPNVVELIEENRDRLACDMVVSADGGQWGEDQPTLLVGFKGMCALQINVRGPGRDLHSGLYGGTVQNPVHALVRLIDSMRRPDGTITVEGFYDDVDSPTDEDRRQIARIPLDDTEYAGELDVAELFGEPGYSTLERAWTRPTLEVNGIWGGFTDDGIKTVLPSEAHAKITCRLVPNQEPGPILECLDRHITANVPPGVSVDVHAFSTTARPYVVAPDHPANIAARDVLTEIYGREPYYTRSGGTLPICGALEDRLGVSTVIFAFGLDDERQHAPDEFFRLSSFRLGQRAWCRLLEKLGE